MLTNKIKLYISLTCLSAFLPITASAKGGWAIMEQGKDFLVQGECLEEKVTLDLFSGAEDNNPVYTFDSECKNGKFLFSSDKLKEDILAGNYIIAVDGEKNWNTVSIKNEDKNNKKKSMMSVSQNENPIDPDIKFLGAVANLQQALLDMQIWISQTSYSQMIKNSIDMTVVGLQTMASKISEFLLAADDPISDKLGEENTETESIDSPLLPNENLQTNQNQSSDQQAVDLKTENISAEKTILENQQTDLQEEILQDKKTTDDGLENDRKEAEQ